MQKNLIVILLMSLMMAGCKRDMTSDMLYGTEETSTEIIAEIETQMEKKKDISEYEDCTATIKNSFEVTENANLIPAWRTGCFSGSYDTVGDLCKGNENVVVGKIIDLTYIDPNGSGLTFYSFAVTEVLNGEEVKEETIITVYDCQGYCRLKTHTDIYGMNGYEDYEPELFDSTYLVTTFTEPLVQIGEEYVLFLGKQKHGWEEMGVEGDYYRVAAPYIGKYKLNEDGLYERYLSVEDLIYIPNEPLSLDEIKRQINDAVEADGVKE